MNQPLRHPEQGNATIVCSKCASKPNPAFAKMPLEYFIGKYIKLGVPVDPNPQNIQHEHLWFHVTGPDNETGQEELIGSLTNIPAFLSMSPGDQMAFSRHEIEDITDHAD